MEIVRYPARAEWPALAKRPAMDVSALFDTVRTVLERVRLEGDKAVKAYEEQFDKVTLTELRVGEAEMEEAERLVPDELKCAIRRAMGNIERFHAAQRFGGVEVETTPGVRCWQRALPIEKVGLYIPGGTAPLFSTVLMLAVAGFTMISGLLIIILERTNMIGMLKALGETNRHIREIFLYVSFFLIGKGMLWGNLIGLGCCWLQAQFQLVKLDPEVYYLEAVPIDTSLGLWLLLNGSTLLVSMLMMLGPSCLITRIDPAKSIRFE